jgi:NADPH:quinone reductase-like Zn-dependent oxidoreductase
MSEVHIHQQTAVVQTRYGRAEDVLELRSDVPVLPPQASEVQIEVKAASINPIDWQMIEGNRQIISRRKFPFVPLFDLAGIVREIGPSVQRFKVGDRVHCDNKVNAGGATQFVNVQEELVSPVPASLDFPAAAAVPLAGQTALLALDRAQVGPGDSLCIIGASGGVGSFIVQMAKARGVSRVIAVCSGQNASVVRSLGADDVIDYNRQCIETALGPASIDAVIDCVGGKNQWIGAKRVLRKGGRFVTIARDEDEKVTVGAVFRLLPPVLWRMFASRFGRRLKYIMVFLDANRILLDRVDEMIASGEVKPLIAGSFSLNLSGIVSAINISREGRVVGKLVLEASAGGEGQVDRSTSGREQYRILE